MRLLNQRGKKCNFAGYQQIPVIEIEPFTFLPINIHSCHCKYKNVFPLQPHQWYMLKTLGDLPRQLLKTKKKKKFKMLANCFALFHKSVCFYKSHIFRTFSIFFLLYVFCLFFLQPNKTTRGILFFF